MQMKYPVLSVLLLALGPAAAAAQSGWRVGLVASAATTVLEVNELAVPDSNRGQVRLGVAYGAEASRWWVVAPKVNISGFARLMTAQVDASSAAGSWSPGRAFVADAGGRVEREVGPGASLFAGAGVSHWNGPDRTAPFAGAATLMLLSEAGVTLHPGDRRTRIDVTASLTRFGADEDRAVVTGFVWRFLVGVRRGL
jgi:hypothetical protein